MQSAAAAAQLEATTSSSLACCRIAARPDVCREVLRLVATCQRAGGGPAMQNSLFQVLGNLVGQAEGVTREVEEGVGLLVAQLQALRDTEVGLLAPRAPAT